MAANGRNTPIERSCSARRLIALFLITGAVFWACDIDDGGRAGYSDNQHAYPYSPGWYRGVLHCHAFYEEAPWLTPIAAVVDIAEEQGLDFFVITNHNTVFQWASPGYHSRALTVLYGVEWTTGQGHANIWSNQPFAFQEIVPTIEAADARRAIRAVHELSTDERPVLFSINHPDRQKGDEPSWKASADDSKDADAIEVWNRDDIFTSAEHTASAYIDQGIRMTMVGGSDAHLKAPDDMQTFTDDLGEPTTWVYADSRDGSDILAGIRQGHVFISADPQGPRLDFFARSDHGDIMMGETIPADALGREVDFAVWVSDAKTPYGVVVIKNGAPQEAWSRTFTAAEDTFSFTDSPQAGDYYRIEIRRVASQGVPFDELLLGPISALSNPIYTW